MAFFDIVIEGMGHVYDIFYIVYEKMVIDNGGEAFEALFAVILIMFTLQMAHRVKDAIVDLMGFGK